MMVALYALALTIGGVAFAAGLLPLAAAAGLVALAIAGRFELRAAGDHARGRTPRPVPPSPTRVVRR